MQDPRKRTDRASCSEDTWISDSTYRALRVALSLYGAHLVKDGKLSLQVFIRFLCPAFAWREFIVMSELKDFDRIFNLDGKVALVTGGETNQRILTTKQTHLAF
jgi:hypothetical protein